MVHSMEDSSCIPGFRPVPKTGVIYVTSKAEELGFSSQNSQWANLGQGAPETDVLAGDVQSVPFIDINAITNEYAPVAGLPALRQKVADLYNSRYRAGKASQYTADNVAICSGGRLALTRLSAAIGEVNMGHFLPDYTAYEELLNVFKAFTPIPILLSEENDYEIPLRDLRNEILGRGLRTLLLSNPCNPTGQHIRGRTLQSWVELMRETECTCIFDEFYSHYVYGDAGKSVSAAEFVEDVNSDPVIIVDGLTKNWRLPGWRICWTVGPKEVIQTVSSAGSFLDGGAPHPLQAAAVDLLDVRSVEENTKHLQTTFVKKRDYVVMRLTKMGITVDVPPQGAFYCWANLSHLPKPLNDGMSLFEAGLSERVITVPGEFFDVNPGKRRRESRYRQFSRISFGPSMEILVRGLDALERVIAKSRASHVMQSDSSCIAHI